MRYLSIIKKKQVQLKGFEIHVDAERSETHPKVFTKINIKYMFYGEKINPVHVVRVIELSAEKYYPVSAILKTSVQITSSYKILNEKM